MTRQTSLTAALAGHGAERDDRATFSAAVLLRHVFDPIRAPPQQKSRSMSGMEIRSGFRNARRAIVLQGSDVGDAQAYHRPAAARTPTGPTGTFARARSESNPSNQK